MSLKAMVWAFEQRIDSPPAKLLLLCLAHHAGFANECWPSIKTLTEETELSKRTIIRLIQRLTASGHMTRTREKRADGRYGINRYVLLLPPSATLAPGPSAKNPAPGATVGTTIRTENRTKKDSIFVNEGTPQWKAWCAHLGKRPPMVNFGWYFPSEWPPETRRLSG